MVREILSLLALGSLLLLPACAQTMTTPPAPPLMGQTEHAATPHNRCNAAPARVIAGKKATRELLEQARVLAGARLLRVVGHDEMVTQEFNASRLTVLLDEKGVVAEVNCG